MRKLIASTLLVFGLVVMLTWAGCSRKPGGAEANKITILWAKWAPADALQKLCDEYTARTGITVVVDQKPWGSIGDVKNQEFAQAGTTYDLFVGDSQWIGQGVVGGHYVDLTDVVTSDPSFKDVMPAALAYYAEYPKASKKYYAVPCESDAMGIAYRKDLFEDAAHKAAFKAFAAANGKADAELAVPKTWEETVLIARYFKEKSGIEGMAGIVLPTKTDYDQATMSYMCLLWSYGGDWGDYQRKTVTIKSRGAVEALTVLKQLIDASTAQGANMDYGDVGGTFASGKAAMALDYFANFPNYNSPKENKDYFAKTGYFNVPAGPSGRFTALGGQGLSLNAHIDAARQTKAKEFLKWFSTPETQKKWAALGGYTANTKILGSEEFKKAAPYNGLFVEAFGMMRDFWNTPQYDQLLTSAQTNISAALQGKVSPQQAIETMQAEQEKVMSKAR